MDVILDGNLCTTREKMHLQLKEKLNLPEYYGMNLDALYDCVSTMNRVSVHLIHWDAMIASLGQYGQLVIQTLEEAAEENPGFEFTMEDDNEDDAAI